MAAVKSPDLIVIMPVKDWVCARCTGSGDLLTMGDAGPLCMTCADLDHLVFLTLAVVASVRHHDTGYDSLLMSGVPREVAPGPHPPRHRPHPRQLGVDPPAICQWPVRHSGSWTLSATNWPPSPNPRLPKWARPPCVTTCDIASWCDLLAHFMEHPRREETALVVLRRPGPAEISAANGPARPRAADRRVSAETSHAIAHSMPTITVKLATHCHLLIQLHQLDAKGHPYCGGYPEGEEERE